MAQLPSVLVSLGHSLCLLLSKSIHPALKEAKRSFDYNAASSGALGRKCSNAVAFLHGSMVLQTSRDTLVFAAAS